MSTIWAQIDRMATLLRDVRRSGGNDVWSHLKSHGHSYSTVQSAIVREYLIANGYHYQITNTGHDFLTWHKLTSNGTRAMSTRIGNTHEPKIDKSGRTRLQPTKPRVSVSKAIAMRKSEKQKVVRTVK